MSLRVLARTAIAVLFTAPLQLPAATAYTPEKGERIALVGGGLGERFSLYGHFESLLHLKFPTHELSVRNFCWPADEVGRRQRPNDYTVIDDPLKIYEAQTFFCFFGYAESFASEAGIAKFKADYAAFLDDYGPRYGRDGSARFVLVSPIALEDPADPLLPSGVAENRNLKLYTAAVREVAQTRNLPFVDLFTPTLALFSREPGAQFTVQGFQLNEAGDREVGRMLVQGLFGSVPEVRDDALFARLRDAVMDKAWVHQNDYRMLNGWYVYGGRRTWDKETFPLEYKKIRGMARVRDRIVWDLAQGRPTSSAPDDSATGDLFIPKTRFGVPQQAYSEPKALRYLDEKESLEAMTVHEGFEVSLFASEAMFPEIAKPVQLNFDNRGRLWVSTMPTYPQWRPGDPKPTDKLVILEDTDHDGRADKSTVFSDQLHCPTGFEFFGGGVLVMSQPRLLWLRDTDGDDRADQVTYLSDGWASDDTHHTFGAWEWSPGGLLHGLEGVAMSTTLETPWGAFRNHGTPGSYVVEPRTGRVRHFITPGYGNPWCYVYNFWGQGICGDGTTAQMHWDSPLSGAQVGQRKGLNAVFNNEGMRPALGSEFLHSRHLPDDVQGQFVYGCVINMNGIPRFQITDDGAGFTGKRVKNLVDSTDRNFRPGETQIGPDGALWFLDWHNPLIGHMQYSQRDPNRDKIHGRIYRLTAKGRPLLKPATQHGKSIPEILDQLREYEPRTRYRARRELRDRPAGDVLPAVQAWLKRLDASDPWHDLHQLEALFVMQGHHQVDPAHLRRVLAARHRDARALAVRVLSDEYPRIPGAFALLRPMVTDTDPRVRLEAVRALSFVNTAEAAENALLAAAQPLDYWLDYTLQHTLGALQSQWKDAHQAGTFAQGNAAGREYLDAYVKGQPSIGLIADQLKKLIDDSSIAQDQRDRLIAAVAKGPGREREGRFVFERVCTSCHKVKDFGVNYGPDLTQVASRLKREQIIESILYPNKDVAPEWLTTNITTRDGEEYSGVLASETETSVTLKLGGDLREEIAKSNIEARETLKVSNMPEGLAAGLAPQEFLDLIQFLSTLK